MHLPTKSALLLTTTFFSCCKAIQTGQVLSGHDTLRDDGASYTHVSSHSSSTVPYANQIDLANPALLPLSSTLISTGISAILNETRTTLTSTQTEKPPSTLSPANTPKLFRFHADQLDEWPEVHRATNGLMDREPAPRKDKHTPTPTPTPTPTTTHEAILKIDGPLELGSVADVKRPANNLWSSDWRWYWKRGAHPLPIPSSVSTSRSSQAFLLPLPTDGSGAAARMHRHAAYLAHKSRNVSSSSVNNSTTATSTSAPARSSASNTLVPVANPGYFHKVAPGLMRPRAAEASPTATTTTTTTTPAIDDMFQAGITHRTVTDLKRRHTHEGSTTPRTRTSSAHRPRKSKARFHRIAPHLKYGGSRVSTKKSPDEEEDITFEAQATHRPATGLFRRNNDE